jgi:dihydrofolate reductase
MKAIMACDTKGGVARNGTLPWDKNPEDLKWFRFNTKNGIVIMGSDTWHDPIMPTPLSNRTNVVVSSKLQLGADYTISGNMVEMLTEMKRNGLFDSGKDIWVIGGPNTLNQFMPYITEIYLTLMHDSYDCDKFIDLKQFNTWRKTFMQVNKSCTFFIYQKEQ